MLKILANDGMAKSAVESLKAEGHQVETDFYEGEALVSKLKEVDVVVIRSKTKIRKELIDKILGGNLKLIIRAGVGIDNIDHEYAKEKGIAVKNTPNSSSASVAELAIGHMFTLARHIHKSNLTMRNGEWNKKAYQGIELNGKTLGLIGFGRIAKETAKRALALGMTVIYTNRSGADKSVSDCNYVDMDKLLKESDFISLHIPYDKAAGATIAKTEFDKMKQGVYLINCARGGVVNESDLLDALNSGKVAAAGVDVFEQEPTQNAALYSHENVSVTPHIGASTEEAQVRIGNETVDVIKDFFK